MRRRNSLQKKSPICDLLLDDFSPSDCKENPCALFRTPLLRKFTTSRQIDQPPTLGEFLNLFRRGTLFIISRVWQRIKCWFWLRKDIARRECVLQELEMIRGVISYVFHLEFQADGSGKETYLALIIQKGYSIAESTGLWGKELRKLTFTEKELTEYEQWVADTRAELECAT